MSFEIDKVTTRTLAINADDYSKIVKIKTCNWVYISYRNKKLVSSILCFDSLNAQFQVEITSGEARELAVRLLAHADHVDALELEVNAENALMLEAA